MAYRDVLKSTFAATPECLSPEQLEALLDGKQSHSHLTNCPRCQAELALLKTFESGSPLPDEGAAVAWISSHLDRQLDSIKNPSGVRARAAIQNLETHGSWMTRVFSMKGFRWAAPALVVSAGRNFNRSSRAQGIIPAADQRCGGGAVAASEGAGFAGKCGRASCGLSFAGDPGRQSCRRRATSSSEIAVAGVSRSATLQSGSDGSG